MDTDEVQQAWARLLALRAHLPDGYEVHERVVAEYQGLLATFESELEVNLNGFRLAPEDIRPRLESATMATRGRPGRVNYSDDNYCLRSTLLIKLDGLVRFIKDRIRDRASTQAATSNETLRSTRTTGCPPTRPTIFMSYSWDSAAHKIWVENLATRLRGDGLDATLDRWHLELGDRSPQFMEGAVRDADTVVVICTPEYKARFDRRTGGVGYEGHLISGDLVSSVGRGRFIPVLRDGDWNTALPSALSGIVGADLRGDPYSPDEYAELVRKLHKAQRPIPPIGERPTWLDRSGLPTNQSEARESTDPNQDQLVFRDSVQIEVGDARLAPDELVLKREPRDTGFAPGLVMWLENSGLKPLDDCSLVIENLQTFSVRHKEFRSPDFEDQVLIAPTRLNPDGAPTGRHHSDAVTLARINNPKRTELVVAVGHRFQGVRERRPRWWRATLLVKAGARVRREVVFFRWKPGQIPELANDPRVQPTADVTQYQ